MNAIKLTELGGMEETTKREQTSMQVHSCYECVHFEVQSPYAFGLCMAPLPAWAMLDSPVITKDTATWAEDCDVYERKE